jgi:cytochrome c biogenesis protein CcmG/thiol:disulfide interchange protein DsbE
MTQRRLLTLTATLILAGFLSLLAYGLLSAGGSGTLAREIADGKRPPTPRIDLGLLYPPRRDWQPRDRRILADSRIQTRELAGTPTLINIWASWCIPCRQEAPVLEQAAAGHRDVRFIGINVRDANAEALAFLRHYQVSYPNLDDPNDQAWRAFQLTGVPESFLIDAAGRIVYHENGPFTNSSIERAFRFISLGTDR